MVFAWMPWMFMFLLGSFASGLVIYWVANNIITFVQQYAIMRSQGVKPDVFGNIIAGFRRTRPKAGPGLPMTGTVTELIRHPIKSIGRELLPSVRLEEGRRCPWDRTWAIVHEASESAGSPRLAARPEFHRDGANARSRCDRSLG